MTAATKTPPGLPERVERGREVARLRAEGLTWPAVAASVRCSEKTARRALAEHERVAPVLALTDVDADEVAARIIVTHQTALEEAERLLSAADNSAAQIGAARTVATVGSSLLDVLARVGLAPTDVARARLQRDMRQFAQAVIESAERHGVPDAALEALFGDLDDAATAAAGTGAAA